MKKYLFTIFITALFFFIPFKVEAATISIAGTTATGVVGGNITVRVTINESKGLGSWEYSLDYDSSKLQLLSGSTHVVGYVDGEGETSKTYTYTFRVKGTGETSLRVINTSIAAWDESVTNPTDSTTIRLVEMETVTKNYSTNNNLASLTVDGYDLDKEFNANETEYTVNVPSDIEKVTIKASASDSKATISGTGEVDVHEGSNTFEIKVTAESGAVKTYKLIVNVEEKDPINVSVNKEDLTVVRKSEELTEYLKDYYKETTVKIGEEDVLAYQIEALDITLVALKDSSGKINFYIYDDGNYTLYQEINGGGVTIHLIDDETKIPDNYKAYKETINDTTYQVYKLNKDSTYYLIYGENVETGEKSLYLYDSTDNTLQKYYEEELNTLKEQLKLNSYIIIGLIGLIVILLIIFLIALHTKKKNNKSNKKEIKKRLKQEKEEFYN